MSKIEQLLKCYEFIRKGWVNSRTQEEEQEWYDKLLIVESEIKAFKARKGSSDLGSSVMAKLIGFNEKPGQKPTEIENTED